MLFEAVPAPITAWRTNAHEEVIVINGLDLTGSVFRLEVRDRRDGGQLRAGLDTVATASAEGVRIAAVDVIDGKPATTLVARFNESTMEAMPLAAEPGDDVTLVWGMHITPVGGLKFMAFDGSFIVKGSAPA